MKRSFDVCFLWWYSLSLLKTLRQCSSSQPIVSFVGICWIFCSVCFLCLFIRFVGMNKHYSPSSWIWMKPHFSTKWSHFSLFSLEYRHLKFKQNKKKRKPIFRANKKSPINGTVRVCATNENKISWYIENQLE